MSIDGSWEYDKEAVEELRFDQKYGQWLAKTRSRDLAFTMVMYEYLNGLGEDEKAELRLILIKVRGYLRV